MNKPIVISSILGALSVIIGAFGAHALKPLLSEYQLSIYHTGVSYQLGHTIIAFIVAIILSKEEQNKYLKNAFFAFVLGIICFSFSLYLLACIDILHLQNVKKIIGLITPLGGILLIAGWIYLIAYGYTYNDKK